MLNQSDMQTEDGHAMMKFDTFHSFQNLSHAVRGCQNSVLLLKLDQNRRHMTTVDLMCTHITTRVCVSPRYGSGNLTVKLPWEVVGSQACQKVVSDGSWAGLSCVVSSMPPIFLPKIHMHH